MKVYLAAPYAARDQLREHAEQLTYLDLDVTCCSSWLTEDYPIHPGTTGAATSLAAEVVERHVEQDLDDVDAADVVVVFTAVAVGLLPEEAASGGRHVETGYAIARGKPVIVVGEPENIFHRSRLVTVARDWSVAVGLLGGMAVSMQRYGELEHAGAGDLA